MISNFVKYHLLNESLGAPKVTQSGKSLIFYYPCVSTTYCTPYVINLAKGVYKFECWGSSSDRWTNEEKFSYPGLGAYTSGTLHVSKPAKFYVYIGTRGFFNAVKGIEENLGGILPGGATDVRLKASDTWWNYLSLISRIMVAAGGGGAEWNQSQGGNGGTLQGGNSTSVYPDHDILASTECEGAHQTSGSSCQTIGSPQEYIPKAGDFG